MNALKYRNEILAPLVVPIVHLHNLTLQQDNARPHVSRVCSNPNPPTNIQDLEQALLQEWNDIPQVIINKLINSMTRHVQAAINANGGHTR